MSAIAAVKLSTLINHALARLTDSATVGVDLTLSPEGISPQGIATWVDRSVSTANPGGYAIGFPRLTLSIRPPSKASRVYKVTAKLVRPTLEQTSASTATGIQPAPTKAYDLTCITEFFLPERSTAAERENLFSCMASLYCDLINASDGAPTDSTGSPLRAAVESFENVY